MKNITTQKITIEELVAILEKANPLSSFVSAEVTTEGNFYKGKNGSRKKADKRNFEILKTCKSGFQVGGKYLTRYNNEAEKQNIEKKTETKKNWFYHVNDLIVRHEKTNKPYLMYFKKKEISKKYHDENGKDLSKQDLQDYAKPKKENDANILSMGVFDFEKMHTFKFNKVVYKLR